MESDDETFDVESERRVDSFIVNASKTQTSKEHKKILINQREAGFVIWHQSTSLRAGNFKIKMENNTTQKAIFVKWCSNKLINKLN